jgi:acetyltransferase
MDTDFVDCDVALRDGRLVHLRAMQPSDEVELLQAFERMDADARYMRFMRAVREPNLERVRKVLASFPAGGLGIVATAPAADGVDIVGSAIFLVGSNASSCEFAINVSAAYGGAGLGGTLMNALIGAARRRGLADMEGFVLAANKPMLRLASGLGFSVAPDPDDSTVRLCHLHLGDP